MDGPNLLITELEDINEINDILLETIDTAEIVNSLIDEIIENTENTENTTKKRKIEEETKEQHKHFAIGVFSGSSYTPVRRHKTIKKHSKQKKYIPVFIEDAAQKQARLLRLFTNTNPYSTHFSIVNKMAAEKKPSLLFHPQKKPISLIIKNQKPNFMPYVCAYLALKYFSGTLFDWEVRIRELGLKQPLFQHRRVKSSFKFKLTTATLFGPGPYFFTAAIDIYESNQRLRWLFKRLLNSWLVKKAKTRKIDYDLITLEKVPEEEQIEVFCIKSRSLYIFSGSSILKTVRSSLESQQGSISNVIFPKNPFTMINFNYGQLLKLFLDITKWCIKKGKPYPAVLALFQEANFNTNTLCSLHNDYLQYTAIKNYMVNDHIGGTFFLENLEVLIDSYEQYLRPHAKYLDVELFRLWFIDEKDSALLKNWRRLVSDYWHYKQTDNLIRPLWNSEMSILNDIKILLKASEYKLDDYV